MSLGTRASRTESAPLSALVFWSPCGRCCLTARSFPGIHKSQRSWGSSSLPPYKKIIAAMNLSVAAAVTNCRLPPRPSAGIESVELLHIGVRQPPTPPNVTAALQQPYVPWYAACLLPFLPSPCAAACLQLWPLKPRWMAAKLRASSPAAAANGAAYLLQAPGPHRPACSATG